ncbi:hypothetical protein GCM10010121_095850 [Streptomyces brasiliensis]|uniref:Uncharacterized protein n=1 Tax=Streptomyces brasiliensis TaxID=1954 RepID=A0A917PC11_9ACTN|nr:hypothetical protein GCM10010121_095850 [Streptomyces brasiliensis]
MRQEMRINCATADLEHSAAIQAACWSKTRVWPAPCRAQGTAAATTPCARQRIRGSSASRNTFIVPASRHRQRRRPRPWS